jgi:hypothetical protein
VGPTGNGTQILDGTAVWKMVGGYDSTSLGGQHRSMTAAWWC